ncbi:MAG: hypothetical protein NTZ16_02965 [Verrucomicrobia bacterium]|nr:hypothetical protein [Verrucomicrobiota bacterium]
MFRFFKELYLTCFTVFFRFGGDRRTPRINTSIGVAGVTLIEWVSLVGIAGWIDILTGTKSILSADKWAIRIAFLALCFVNHYILISRGHGITFEREFANLKKSKKVFLLASCLVMMLAAIAFFIHAGFAHRRFIHIS